MKKLTKKQKAANKRKYDRIRKAWKSTGGKKANGQDISYKQFKNRVEAQMNANDLDVKAAIKKELNTETFTTAAERSRSNLLESIKSDYKDVYDDLRYKSRDSRGRLTKLSGNMVWDTERNGYVVGGKYFIDVSNSPEEIVIREI